MNITMPTIDDLRMMARRFFERERAGAKFNLAEQQEYSFVIEELRLMDALSVYHEERRRSALIRSGYNPPEELEPYRSAEAQEARNGAA